MDQMKKFCVTENEKYINNTTPPNYRFKFVIIN